MNIAEWLEQIGMTPSELANELGLPRSQVSRLIVGEEEPDRLMTWALNGLRASWKEHKNTKTKFLGKKISKNSLAEELSDDTWTGETSRIALPILIDIAKSSERSKITYTELHNEVVKRGGRQNIGKMTKYSFPLGRIARAMERLELPPLTSIVVKSSNGIPSSGINGFIERHLELGRGETKALRDDDVFRRKIIEKIWDEVFSYQKWEYVMEKLGITGDPKYDA